jgi:THO complex subunit 4
VAISRGRPVLRVKNIHPDLNGEDLSKLFGTVSPVDFVKFDNRDDTMAYVCFQSDNQRSNGESVAKFDGKKAMGNRLVVEVATSLADRIQVQTIHRNDHHRNPKHEPRQSQRQNLHTTKKSKSKPKPEKKSLDMLDDELSAYMNQGESATGDQGDQGDQQQQQQQQQHENESSAHQTTDHQPGEQQPGEQDNDDMNLD